MALVFLLGNQFHNAIPGTSSIKDVFTYVACQLFQPVEFTLQEECINSCIHSARRNYARAKQGKLQVNLRLTGKRECHRGLKRTNGQLENELKLWRK